MELPAQCYRIPLKLHVRLNILLQDIFLFLLNLATLSSQFWTEQNFMAVSGRILCRKMITKDLSAVSPCLANWWWQTVKRSMKQMRPLCSAFPSSSKLRFTQISVSSWSLFGEDAVTPGGGTSGIWKLPWQGGRLFLWHCFKGLSSCVSALKIVTVIPRLEYSLLFGAFWETLNMLVVSANRLKTDNPVSLNMKIFQCSLLICGLSQKPQSSSSMRKNYPGYNFTVSSLKSGDFY